VGSGTQYPGKNRFLKCEKTQYQTDWEEQRSKGPCLWRSIRRRWLLVENITEAEIEEREAAETHHKKGCAGSERCNCFEWISQAHCHTGYDNHP
jgi:hypothetical protein